LGVGVVSSVGSGVGVKEGVGSMVGSGVGVAVGVDSRVGVGEDVSEGLGVADGSSAKAFLKGFKTKRIIFCQKT